MVKGQFYKRGDRWYGRVDLPEDPKTHKRRQKRFNGRTKREVEEKAAQTIASISAGGFAEADATKITVSVYLDRWLASIEGTIRPSSHRRYADIVRLHFEPKIGRLQLAKLSPLDVQRLYEDRLAAGLSPTTVSMHHNVLHRALKQAVRWNLLTRNVTEAVDPPRETTPEYTTWSDRQVVAFFAVTDDDKLAALWKLALLTGMRRGEILGLKWADVDLERGVLSVQRTLSRGSDGAYVFSAPKTAAGRRAIALPRSVTESLRKHRINQIKAKFAVGQAYQDQNLVFANEIGKPIHPNSLYKRFKRLTDTAGLPQIRIHDLRHTSATLMLANGEHPKIVQERLGHSDVSMTLNRYSHVTMDMQRDAADRLDKLIRGTS